MIPRRVFAAGLLLLAAGVAAILVQDCESIEASNRPQTADPGRVDPAVLEEFGGPERASAMEGQEATGLQQTFLVRVVGGWPLEPIRAAYVGPTGHGSAWGTDDQGLVSLDRSLDTGGQWFVQHDRWERWEGALPDPGEDGVVEIRLESGGVIEGRLSGEEVMREWKELRVLVRAAPRNHEEFWSGQDAGIPWIEAVVPVDSSGAFRVQGLKRELAYTIYAGGGGCISPNPLREIIPDAYDLEIAILPLWGLQIEFRKPGGESIRTHPRLRTYHGFSWSVPDRKDAVSVPPDHPALIFVGLQPTDYFERSFHEHLMMYAAPASSPMLVQCGVTLAGYSRWQESIELLRCRHSVPRQAVELEEIASGWGQLTVVLDGLPANAPGSDFYRDVDFVLWPVEPAMKEVNLMLAMLSPRPVTDSGAVMDGIPSGVYRVEAYGVHDFGLWKKWGPRRDLPEVLVPPGGAATVAVDWSQHGHARFLGQVPAPVTVRRVDQPDQKWSHGGGHDGWATFAGLAPGEYEYSVTLARHAHWNQGPWTPFRVAAGALTVVPLGPESGEPPR